MMNKKIEGMKARAREMSNYIKNHINDNDVATKRNARAMIQELKVIQSEIFDAYEEELVEKRPLIKREAFYEGAIVEASKVYGAKEYSYTK